MADHTKDAQRQELARTSICEISTILDMLDREFAYSNFVIDRNLWRGAHLRLSTLVNVALTFDDDGEFELSDLIDQVHGTCTRPTTGEETERMRETLVLAEEALAAIVDPVTQPGEPQRSAQSRAWDVLPTVRRAVKGIKHG